MHEHIFVAFDGASLDPTVEFDRTQVVNQAVKRLRALKALGVDTLVDPCPIELGRDVALMAEVSECSEVRVVCSTGFYHESMGLPPYWRQRTVDEIAELYVCEIEQGIAKTGIRAGIIKCATGSPGVTELEKKFLAAASIAHKATGVPILTHTTLDTGAPEQQDEFEKHGVPLHRCLIGHCCNSADSAYHRRVVERGSYIGFDRLGMPHYHPDEVHADNIVRLRDKGFLRKILLSQDRCCVYHGKPYRPLAPHEELERQRQMAAGDWPAPLTDIITKFLPMLRERGVSEAEIGVLLDENPQRFFAGGAV